ATDEMRGRTQGVFTVVVAGGRRVADVTHGWAAAGVGTAAAASGGGVLVIVGVVIAMVLIPAFWRYRAPVAKDDEAPDAQDRRSAEDRSGSRSLSREDGGFRTVRAGGRARQCKPWFQRESRSQHESAHVRESARVGEPRKAGGVRKN